MGVLATHYAAGVRDSDHRRAHTPGDLLDIFHEISHSAEAYDRAVTAIAEWMSRSPSPQPVRTRRIGGDSYDHAGWGAGSGSVERLDYRCPCGEGTIVEEHEDVPGFREHDVWIACDNCRGQWRFVAGRSTRQWGLEPIVSNSAG